MESFLAPGGTVALLIAFWVDTRRRTNGTSPLAAKIDSLAGKVDRIDAKVDRLDARVDALEGWR